MTHRLPHRPPRDWARPNATAALLVIAFLAVVVITIAGGFAIGAAIWEAMG